MKHLFKITLLMVLLQSQAFSQSGWQWVNPMPEENSLKSISIGRGTSENLNSVHFPDNNIGFIAGDVNSKLKTKNDVTNWIIQYSGTTNNLSSVHFTDNNTGYIVGDSGTILKTTNRGANWSDQESGTGNNLKSVSFADNNTGWTVGTPEQF